MSARAPQAGVLGPMALHGLAAALFLLILLVDIVTPADNVSLCFAYTFPTLITFFHGRRAAFVYAAIGSVLSVFGSLFQPPTRDILVIFIANRVIAIVVLWIAAMLIHYRLTMEAALKAGLERERAIVEQQRSFISIVSHEFRTPLTTIDGQAYRLIKLHAAIAPADIAARAQKIREAVARMIATIDVTLFSFRVGEGDIRFEAAALDLKALLDDICQQAREMAPEHGIVCRTDDLPPAILADGRLLTHVFTNLLSNARKFSPPEPGPEPGRTPVIEVEGRRDGAMVAVTVRDHGMGIAPADLPHLFRRYFRGENARGVPGTGIGLYLVAKLVELHAGRITVDSAPGAGTAVTVHLPIMMPGREGEE